MNTCPVCGKGEWEPVPVGDPMWPGNDPVSHLACVESQREESLLMKARYQECEAELVKCKWMLDEALLDDHYSDRDDLERRWAERGTK